LFQSQNITVAARAIAERDRSIPWDALLAEAGLNSASVLAKERQDALEDQY
jgi:hypothetical protein